MNLPSGMNIFGGRADWSMPSTKRIAKPAGIANQSTSPLTRVKPPTGIPRLQSTAPVSNRPYPRGPQNIPEGTPGTYVSDGGRVIPESYRPIAEAQTAYSQGAGKGLDMNTYMNNLGLGNPAPGGLIAGLPSEGWNYNTMSTPAMDEASGKVNVPISQLVSKLQKGPELDAQIKAFEDAGLPPSWYSLGAKTFEEVIAEQNHDPLSGQVLF